MRAVRRGMLWLTLGLVGCFSASSPSSSPGPAPASSEVALPVPPLPADHGLRTVERWVGGASEGDDVPVIVAVHGLGDSPERFGWVLEGLGVPARVVLPAGPTPFADGYAWMTLRHGQARDEALARQVDASAARVAALCRDLAREGHPPVLTGFSQGGMVTWAVAVRHPRTITAAFPVAGYLDAALAPERGQPMAPITALHGMSDDVVALELDLAGARLVQAAGGSPDLRTYPGRGHVIDADMLLDLHAGIRQALARQQAISPGPGGSVPPAPRVDPDGP